MAEPWYDNKELFGMVCALKESFLGLRAELAETQRVVKEYNELRTQLDTVCSELAELKNITKGKKHTSEGIRVWCGWAVALLLALFKLLDMYIAFIGR